jgi:adenylylsulfate kinase-like enzyme
LTRGLGIVKVRVMAEARGFLVWVTGLAGSGKTTLGRSLHDALAACGTQTVLLDGDVLREITGDVFGYGRDDRLRCAEFYARLCALLTEQGVNVICCTVSMFESVRERNRRVVPRYLELYLRASEPLLRARNQRKLYDAGATNVVGLDLEMEAPKRPDLVFELGESGLSIDEMRDRAMSAIRKELLRGVT